MQMSEARMSYLRRILDGKVTCYTPEELDEAQSNEPLLRSGIIPDRVWKSEPHHNLIAKAMTAGRSS